MHKRFFSPTRGGQQVPISQEAHTSIGRASTLSLISLLLALAVMVAGCEQIVASHPASRPVSRSNAPSDPSQIQIEQEVAGAWLTFGNDPAYPSINTSEQAINAKTVSKLRRLWHVQLPDLADERPVLVRNLTMPDAQKSDVLYMTTDDGTLAAIDADNGHVFWTVTPRAGYPNAKYTKASPAADPANNLIYSYGLDGRVHRFRLTTGQEITGNGWPVRVTTMPLSEKVSSALNLIDGYLYVTTASFSGDAPPYQGHMVAIRATCEKRWQARIVQRPAVCAPIRPT
jgi:outer membrane protein assembly factor BamB